MAKRQVRTHWFNGVKYIIDIEPFVGSCSPPTNWLVPEIVMPNGLAYGESRKAKDDLRILLHEVRHAQNFDLSESITDREAIEIRDLLWRLGYRRIE